MEVAEFKRLLAQKGEELYRDMPWRQDTRPYYVLVSELMLQQTQVARVIPKFEAFITRFPSEKSLAVANLSDVLLLWQGLGYNRRAKFLHEAAKMIVNERGGRFPTTEKDLMMLPGVGKNTAGAILAYTYNYPSIYVETNVRTVYIHHFFEGAGNVNDTAIIELLGATINTENPRQFYQNLMDYGSWLKTNGVRNTSSSTHYKKQKPLKGSVREMRGMILKHLVRKESLHTLKHDERFASAIDGLLKDGMIHVDKNTIELTK